MPKNKKNLGPKSTINRRDSTDDEKAMTDKLIEKRKGHWYYFSEGELDHIFRCIDELSSVSWAAALIKRADQSTNLIDWFAENKDKIDQLEWLENWAKMEELRTTFFEVRYAFDLYKQGIIPTYEKPTLGKSSVDLEISVPGATFLVELVSTVQTDYITKNTEHPSEMLRIVRANDSDELRKVQSKIVRKVAQQITDNEYVPHKFPLQEPGSPFYNVIIADTRGFAGGAHLEKCDRGQLVFGARHYLQNGGKESNAHWVGGKQLAGLFDDSKPGTEAQLFRERIHLLGLVSEETFGDGEVIQQTRLYQNHYLPASKQASQLFTFAGQR